MKRVLQPTLLRRFVTEEQERRCFGGKKFLTLHSTCLFIIFVFSLNGRCTASDNEDALSCTRTPAKLIFGPENR